MKRRAGSRQEAERLLIVCEGAKTEITYFEGIRKHYRVPRTLWRIEPGGGHPQSVVDLTDQLIRDEAIDKVWWVFDVESPNPHPKLDDVVARAEQKGYTCAVSHPCFELWLLLHFQSQTASMTSAAATRMLREKDCGYDDKGFSFEKVWNNTHLAVKRAVALHDRQIVNNPRFLDRNPWTSVHALVSEMIRLGEARS